MTLENKPTQMGRVVSVTQSTNGMVTCSVQLSHSGGQENNVPVGKPHSGVMWKPKPGWAVVIDYLDDGTPYISDFLSVPSKDYQAPQLAEGSMTFRFDDSTAITVDKDGNGNYTVDLSANGSAINIDGQGSITIDGGADVSVQGADAVEVDGSAITLGTDGGDSTLVTDVSTTKDSNGKVTSVDTTKTSKTSAE